MTDIFGSEINVGDTVAFRPPYEGPGLVTGTVDSLTPERVRIRWEIPGYTHVRKALKDPKTVVVKKVIINYIDRRKGLL